MSDKILRFKGHKFSHDRSNCENLNVIAHCECGWSARKNRTMSAARDQYRAHLMVIQVRLEKAAKA